MNIKDVWPEEIPPILLNNTKQAWAEILLMQQDTYRKFAVLEDKNESVLAPKMSYDSKRGQDALRMLWARSMEELLEFFDSVNEEHKLEELIDSFNYALCLLLIDDISSTHLVLISALLATECTNLFDDMNPLTLFEVYIQSNLFLSTLRNRSWQHSVQSQYFDGMHQIIEHIVRMMRMMFQYFEYEWTMFIQYYLAKQEVLKFRLATNY